MQAPIPQLSLSDHRMAGTPSGTFELKGSDGRAPPRQVVNWQKWLLSTLGKAIKANKSDIPTPDPLQATQECSHPDLALLTKPLVRIVYHLPEEHLFREGRQFLFFGFHSEPSVRANARES